MSLVLDGSMTLSWYFEDERTPHAEKVLEHVVGGGAVVPSLWKLEVANGFQSSIRRRRIDTAYRDKSLADLAFLNITIDSETNFHAWNATVRLADKCHLTPYGAAYLELALRHHLPLATLDKDLQKAAKMVGVKIS